MRGILLIMLVLALILIPLYIFRSLADSDYFRVRDVVTNDMQADDFSYLKGKNIFALNIGDEAAKIRAAYPQCRSIRVIRVFPNRLFIEFIKRKPIAYVKLYKYFSVDDQAVLFFAPGQEERQDLPVIIGLETKIFGPKPGRQYNIRQLNAALEVLALIRKNKALRQYYPKSIDVSDPAGMSLLMPVFPKGAAAPSAGRQYLFEAKLSYDNLAEKIIILAGLIAQARPETANIKYIDLRFKESVIKLNDTKNTKTR